MIKQSLYNVANTIIYHSLKYATKKRMERIVPILAEKFDVPAKLIEEKPLIFEAISVLYKPTNSESGINALKAKIFSSAYNPNKDRFSIMPFNKSDKIVCTLPQIEFVNDIAAYGEEAMHYLHALVNPKITDSKHFEIIEFVGYIGNIYARTLLDESTKKQFTRANISKTKDRYKEQKDIIFKNIENIESRTLDDTIKDANNIFLNIYETTNREFSEYINTVNGKKELDKLPDLPNKNNYIFSKHFEELVDNAIYNYQHHIGYYFAIKNSEAALNDCNLLHRTAEDIFERYISKDILNNTYIIIKQLEEKKKQFSEASVNNGYAN
ncbi:MAG: hypothetical protein KAS12_06950, partial [Candidatus Aenigmarchaeota archaeon]|nr:hypothetical protein [Candidatus Aenigmarchaeota archaeon]